MLLLLLYSNVSDEVIAGCFVPYVFVSETDGETRVIMDGLIRVRAVEIEFIAARGHIRKGASQGKFAGLTGHPETRVFGLREYIFRARLGIDEDELYVALVHRSGKADVCPMCHPFSTYWSLPRGSHG